MKKLRARKKKQRLFSITEKIDESTKARSKASDRAKFLFLCSGEDVPTLPPLVRAPFAGSDLWSLPYCSYGAMKLASGGLGTAILGEWDLVVWRDVRSQRLELGANN